MMTPRRLRGGERVRPGDLVVWVDASERVRSVDPSMGIARGEADTVIHNNGTIDDLREAVKWFGGVQGIIPLTS